jgi:hypothetical protein
MVCYTSHCGFRDFGNNFPKNAVIEYFGTIFAEREREREK